MAHQPFYLTVHVRLDNARAVRALGTACRLIDEAADDLPWRSDLRRARRLLLRAVRGLRPEVRDSD